jgi:hypothetical protein
MARLRARITAVLQPSAVQVEPRQEIPGVNRQAAAMLVAAIGVDMSPCPSTAHLASWAGGGPGHHERAGKRQSGKTRTGNPGRKPLWVECGWGAGRARRTSWWPCTTGCGMGCRLGISARRIWITLPPTGSRPMMCIAWNNSATVSRYSQGQTSRKKRLRAFWGTSESFRRGITKKCGKRRQAVSPRGWRNLPG